MLEINESITIDENELQFDLVRASGPGGQNVNKVSTAVQLRFDVVNSPSLPDDVRNRLVRIAGNRMTNEGILIIEARQYRTQEQNRQDAIDRLVRLLRQAALKPKQRKQTRPTAEAKRRRLISKRRRSELKKMRGKVPRDEV